MDNSYFYIILRFRCLREASSSRSICRNSGENDFNLIYPNKKGYVHIFHIWIVCYTPARCYTPASCVNLPFQYNIQKNNYTIIMLQKAHITDILKKKSCRKIRPNLKQCGQMDVNLGHYIKTGEFHQYKNYFS